MKSDIQNYLKLQTALLNEKAQIEARLNAINKVLGGDVVVTAAPTAAPTSPAPSATTTPGKRTFSAATRAKMKASQQARWAKKKGVVESVVAPAATKKAKRTMSEATKAKMRAAHQARWAKLKGKTGSSPALAPATAPVPAAKKTKRVISPEAKARMIAGAKKRWAKVNAAKKAA